MKYSHERTPRTLDECQFATGYKSADRFSRGLDLSTDALRRSGALADRVILALAVFVAGMACGGMLGGGL